MLTHDNRFVGVYATAQRAVLVADSQPGAAVDRVDLVDAEPPTQLPVQEGREAAELREWNIYSGENDEVSGYVRAASALLAIEEWLRVENYSPAIDEAIFAWPLDARWAFKMRDGTLRQVLPVRELPAGESAPAESSHWRELARSLARGVPHDHSAAVESRPTIAHCHRCRLDATIGSLLAAEAAGESADRCWVCAGSGRRSSWVNELYQEVESACPDCDGTGILPGESADPGGHVRKDVIEEHLPDSIEGHVVCSCGWRSRRMKACWFDECWAEHVEGARS